MSNDARVSDAGSHGGVIVSGAATVIVEGQQTARVGDIYMCPDHGPQPIVSGASKMVVENSATARVGDVAACGAVIVSGAAQLMIE
jgi:uncharacterized Zn-binding protein involved in type VI secretion